MCYFNVTEQDYLEQNEPFLVLKTMISNNCSFQTRSHFSQGTNGVNVAASDIDGFSLESYWGFFNLAEQAHLEYILPFSALKILISKKYSFQKLTQFSKGNNVLDAGASKMQLFHWRDTCVTSTQLISNICTNRRYLHLETPKLQEVFLFNTNSILTGKQCARGSCF